MGGKYRGKGKTVVTPTGKINSGSGINFSSTPVTSSSDFNWQNFADPNMYGSSMSPVVTGVTQPFNFNNSPMDFTGTTPSTLNTGILNLQAPVGTTDFSGLSAPTFSGSDVPSKPFSFADWGSKNKDLISGGVGIANSLANAYFGWKNLGLAKDQFNFQKDSWNKNFANQVITTNNQLEEQARKRYNASPTDNISPEEYMAKHGVK